jgi:hypothetical protein
MLEPGKYYPETEIRLTVSFTNSAGTAIDPATVTFETWSPSGFVSTYVYLTDSAVTKLSTGNYAADIVPGEAGRWHYRWKTSGAGTVIVQEGDFIIQNSKFVDSPAWDYC